MKKEIEEFEKEIKELLNERQHFINMQIQILTDQGWPEDVAEEMIHEPIEGPVGDMPSIADIHTGEIDDKLSIIYNKILILDPTYYDE